MSVEPGLRTPAMDVGNLRTVRQERLPLSLGRTGCWGMFHVPAAPRTFGIVLILAFKNISYTSGISLCKQVCGDGLSPALSTARVAARGTVSGGPESPEEFLWQNSWQRDAGSGPLWWTSLSLGATRQSRFMFCGPEPTQLGDLSLGKKHKITNTKLDIKMNT